jgi:pilus assembly protein Flp/PilA
MRHFIQFLKDEKGATAIEYGLLICLMVFGIVSATTIMGGFVTGTFNRINTGFATR